MSVLQNRLNEILRQKNEYLIPGNLKSGVELLGVIGTYSGSHDTFKVFPSVSSMNSDPDKVLGDRAIVIDTTTGVTRNVKEGDIFHKLYIPNQIVFNERLDWIQEYLDDETIQPGNDKAYACGFEIIDSSVDRPSSVTGETVHGDYYPAADFLVSVTKLSDGSVEYIAEFESMEDGVMHYDLRSTDGLTWTHSGDPLIWNTMECKGVKVRVGQTRGYGITGNDYTKVLPFLSAIFDQVIGIYEVRNYRTAWDSTTGEYTTELRYCPLENQLTSILNVDVAKDKIVMGNNNTIVTGTAMTQEEINTAVDTADEILG